MKGVVVFAVLLAVFAAVFMSMKPAAPPAMLPGGTPSGSNTLKTSAPQTAGAPAMAKGMTPAWPPTKEGQNATVAADLFAKNYYVVLDASGSMNERGCSGEDTKIQAARAALASFTESLPAHANLGLQVFDARGVQHRLNLATGNRPQFNQIVKEVRANAGTPLREAVRQGYARLGEQAAKQLGYGEYHLVIVTDGAADTGQDPTPMVNQVLAESPVVIQTIGFCIGPQHSLNQAGRTIYRAADNPEQLRQGLADVLAEAPQFAVTKFK